MSYQIKEIFGPTIQGEGGLYGTPCLFIRFSGCNMWDGRQETKENSKCPYCDTDFYGGTKMSLAEIMEVITRIRVPSVKWVVLSGGEPSLQTDGALIEELHREGLMVMMETNGTHPLKCSVDWLTVSPKVPYRQLSVVESDDLKLLYPHPNEEMTPESYRFFKARFRFLQPIMDEEKKEYPSNLKKTIKACIETGWRLSLQNHKAIGVK